MMYCPFCAHPNEVETIRIFQHGEVHKLLKCEQCGKEVYLGYIDEEIKRLVRERRVKG